MPVHATLHAFLDQAYGEAARFPGLLIEAERVAATVAQGVHGRRRVGLGETFWQYRRYEWLDETQHIDWRRSGRGDSLFVRETEWEAAQTCYLWRDGSASMGWASTGKLPSKQARAELLALALGILMVTGGEHVGVLGRDALPIGARAALPRLAELLAETSETTDRPRPVTRRGKPVPRHAHAVLFSDFLQPVEAVQETVHTLAERRVIGRLVQVLDPAEETLPYTGRVSFEGLEGEAPELAPRVEDIREAYRERLADRRKALKQLARQTGWQFITHRTDQPPHATLLALYQSLAPIGPAAMARPA